jgi:flagellar motor switch protein FliG
MAVRRKMFSFDDLHRLQVGGPPADPARGGQRRPRHRHEGGERAAAREDLLGLSKRAAEGLREEIQLLGPVRLKDVEAAQDAIIQSVRRLEEAGEISIDSDSAQALVA